MAKKVQKDKQQDEAIILTFRMFSSTSVRSFSAYSGYKARQYMTKDKTLAVVSYPARKNMKAFARISWFVNAASKM